MRMQIADRIIHYYTDYTIYRYFDIFFTQMYRSGLGNYEYFYRNSKNLTFSSDMFLIEKSAGF